MLLITGLVMLSLLIVAISYNPSIHTATYDEILEIYGLGPILTQRVVDYLDDNPNCDIDDLTDVEGIGVKKLSEIKKRYGD